MTLQRVNIPIPKQFNSHADFTIEFDLLGGLAKLGVPQVSFTNTTVQLDLDLNDTQPGQVEKLTCHWGLAASGQSHDGGAMMDHPMTCRGRTLYVIGSCIS